MLLLQVGEGFDEAEGFGFGFEDSVSAATGHDQDIELGKAFVGFFEVDVSPEASALVGGGVFGEGDKGGFEGLGCWRKDELAETHKI
jgi:hypothetical protein